MSVPRLIPILLAVIVTLEGRANDYIWPNHGTISLEVPVTWSVVGKQAADVGYAFNARPNNHSAAVLQITLIDLPADKKIPASALEAQLLRTVQPHLAGSVERTVSPQPLKLAQGSGWFVQLTDASLVGQPPVRDNYKVMRNAILAPDDQALAIATMQFDDPAEPAADEMLAFLSSLRFARGTAPGTLEQAVARGDFHFTAPESRLILSFPADNLTQSTERVGGATNSPRYFKLSRLSPSLVISGWIEPARNFKGVKALWATETGAWKKAGQPTPRNVAFLKVGPWDVIAYELDLPGATNAHLRVEAVQAGTWIDLHLSSTAQEPAAALREKLLTTLRTFRLTEKP